MPSWKSVVSGVHKKKIGVAQIVLGELYLSSNCYIISTYKMYYFLPMDTVCYNLTIGGI